MLEQNFQSWEKKKKTPRFCLFYNQQDVLVTASVTHKVIIYKNLKLIVPSRKGRVNKAQWDRASILMKLIINYCWQLLFCFQIESKFRSITKSSRRFVGHDSLILPIIATHKIINSNNCLNSLRAQAPLDSQGNNFLWTIFTQN